MVRTERRKSGPSDPYAMISDGSDGTKYPQERDGDARFGQRPSLGHVKSLPAVLAGRLLVCAYSGGWADEPQDASARRKGSTDGYGEQSTRGPRVVVPTATGDAGCS